MSYSVFRIQGVKTTGDLKGISKHHKDRVSYTNQDIDKTRSKDNITLVECDNYHSKFNRIVQPMKEEHSKRMETMRSDRVKTFEQHINSSKNDVAFEMVFTSDNEFFKDMSKSDIQNWAEKSLDFATKDLGIDKKNILHAVIHMDEKTPHLHVVAVPLVKTYNKKQKKYVWSISRRQFITGKQQLSEAQDIYNKKMNDNGYKLDRGEKGSEKIHTTKSEYIKEQMEHLKEEVHKSKSEVIVAKGVRENIKDDIKALEKNLEARREALTVFDRLDKVEVQKTFTGSYKLSKDDFELINNIAKEGEVSRLGYNNLDMTNKKLSGEIKKLRQENKRLVEKDKSHNEDFKKEKEKFEKKIGLIQKEKDIDLKNQKETYERKIGEIKGEKDTIENDYKDFKGKALFMQDFLKEKNLIAEMVNSYNNPKPKEVIKPKNKTYEIGD